MTWRRQGAVGGRLGAAVGALLIYGALISPIEAEADIPNVAGSGTPAVQDGIAVSHALEFGPLGRNDVTIGLTDESGTPIDVASVSIDGDMPAMGMTRIPMAATSLGSGRYQISAVPITMSGNWNLDVTVAQPGEDPVTIAFVVPVGG